MLETIEVPENRILLCDVLAGFAKERPDPFVIRLQSDRPQTVRDIVYILEKCQHPDRLKMFAQVLKGKNLVVKLEVMNIVARGHTAEARQLIADLLQDPISQVRMQAAKLLPEFDRDKAYLDLMRIVKDAAFEKKTPDERTIFYAALGATAIPNALTWMTQLLAVKPSLLNKKKVHGRQAAGHPGVGGGVQRPLVQGVAGRGGGQVAADGGALRGAQGDVPDTQGAVRGLGAPRGGMKPWPKT